MISFESLALVYIGSSSLALAMVASLTSVIASIIGIRIRNTNLLIISYQAIWLNFILIGLAVLSLLGLLAKPELSVVYPANFVNLALPLFYRLTALWAGQEGSMLWWNFLLITFSVFAIRGVIKKEPSLAPYMIAILGFISFFFTVLANFSPDSNPFLMLKTSSGEIIAQRDGRGLNPLLQHWAMIIHPPILYFGYVSFAIPFSIAMAALIKNRMNLAWTKLIRRWTIFSWFFLTTGILLGGKWAYEELGWGGYWAWDPVENASLMPWLTGTAFLHSIVVQEKRGMLKTWNMFLVALSFIMTIVGTFLTRSGVVESVHAFAKSSLGPFFLVFIISISLFSIFWIVKRLPSLKSERKFNSLLSREAGFLFNNILLLITLFTVFWGTMYPAISEWITGSRDSLTAPWFNRWIAPLGLIVLFLTGAGPLLAWRKTSKRQLWRNFRFPMLVLILTFSLCYYYFPEKPLAAISFAVSAFVISGVLEEFIRSTLNRISYSKENFFLGLLMTLFQNKRRYIGYMIHISLAVMFIGFTGKMFSKEARIIAGEGEITTFSNHQIEIVKIEKKAIGREANGVPLYVTEIVRFRVYKNNQLIGEDTTERRNYPIYSPRTGGWTDSQVTSEPGIVSTLSRDIYLQYAGLESNGRAIFSAWDNRLVVWVWLGFAIQVFFSILLLFPIGEGKIIRIFGKNFTVVPNPEGGSKK